VIDGYGAGVIETVGPPVQHDPSFAIDLTRLRGMLGDVPSLRLRRPDIEQALSDLGRELRSRNASTGAD